MWKSYGGSFQRLIQNCLTQRLTTDRRILFFFTYLSGRQARSDPTTADGLTTDRRTLFFFTYLSGCHTIPTLSRGRHSSSTSTPSRINNNNSNINRMQCAITASNNNIQQTLHHVIQTKDRHCPQEEEAIDHPLEAAATSTTAVYGRSGDSSSRSTYQSQYRRLGGCGGAHHHQCQ